MGDPLHSDGYWRVMEQNGVHWLRTPAGHPFYSKGINVIDDGEKNKRHGKTQAFYWGNHFSSLAQWRESVKKRLAQWGFNTRGAWSDPSPELKLPLMVELDLGWAAALLWADPFDPQKPDITLQQATKLTAPYRNDPWLIGYFTDNEVGWWNSHLFRWYLKENWANHTKRVLWQLLFDHYQGRWDRLLQDWVPQAALHSFTDLQQSGAQLKLRPGGQGIQLVNQFTYLCTRRYYQLVHQAIRKAHPGALILGDRLPIYYHQDAVRAMADQVDVVSTNYNVDTPDGWVAPYYFEGLQRLTGKPILVTEFFFAAHENRSGNRNTGHLMTVATQAERAQGVASALCNFARFPNVVGTHWFQYADEPTGGRLDGEDYNMGLVDIANRPYEEVTAVFRALHAQLDDVHQRGADKPSLARNTNAVALPRARRPITIDDNSLTEWKKDTSRLVGFQTPEPYVPFADVHLAWRPEGLYLASIASNYIDLDLLSYEGTFPLPETFQLHILVEDDTGKMHHYAIHLLPRHSPLFSTKRVNRTVLTAQIYRYANNSPAEQMPRLEHVQTHHKPLPHIAFESFLPAEWLGMQHLRPGQKIRLNVVLVSFYRALTMSLSSPPTLHNVAESKALKTFVLQDAPQPSLPSPGSASTDVSCLQLFTRER